jgi:hypothetical protein
MPADVKQTTDPFQEPAGLPRVRPDRGAGRTPDRLRGPHLDPRSDFGVRFGLAEGGKIVIGDQVDIQLDIEAVLERRD